MILKISALLLISTLTYASVDSVPGDPVEKIKSEHAFFTSPLSAEEIYARTEFVFSHFNVPAEASSDSLVEGLNGAQTYTGANEILKFLDPKSQWGRFSTSDSSRVESFLDRDAREKPDFRVDLAEGNLKSVAGLDARLAKIAAQAGSAKPLQGLRVALDPGHMGSPAWDNDTGKWVVDAKGVILREGDINLETVLVLEGQLRALGAETMVTHRTFAPVTKLSYSDLDLEAYGREELRSLSLNGWFQSLIAAEPVGSTLAQSFDRDSEVKSLFSEASRNTYFVLRADLDARADAIAQFNPDITLIVHYDVDVVANSHDVNPQGRDAVKTYMPGSFAPEEFAVRRDRAEFAKHLYDPESWNASLNLSRQIAEHIHQELGVPKEETSAGDIVEIEPGVLSRNLNLTRRAYAHATSYVECLYYNNAKEFAAFEKQTHAIVVGGQTLHYSDRLASVATALKNSILDFLKLYAVQSNP